MKTRIVTLKSGESFTVPQGVQRLDSSSTRGWQVRYQGTKYFPDGTVGPKKALDLATKELLRRIATLPAPVSLRRAPNQNKTSDLPVGISGPIVVRKPGSLTESAVLSIAVPRFGKPNLTRKVHIGTANTFTRARYREAVARAIEIREQGMAEYEAAATKARRGEASQLRKALREAASAGIQLQASP
jgi:hypothetical protein